MGRRSVDICEPAAKRIKQIHDEKPHLKENAIINEALLVGLPLAYPTIGQRDKASGKK